MELTVEQSVLLYNAIAKMKDGGISLKGLRNIDMAMNKKAVSAIVEGFQTAQEPPAAYREYLDKQKKLGISHMAPGTDSYVNPGKAIAEINALDLEYSDAIVAGKEWQNSLKAMPQSKFEVELILIPKEDFQIEEKNGLASEVFYGLLPVVK